MRGFGGSRFVAFGLGTHVQRYKHRHVRIPVSIQPVLLPQHEDKIDSCRQAENVKVHVSAGRTTWEGAGSGVYGVKGEIR